MHPDRRQPELAGPPAGYARVPMPDQAPPVAGEPINGQMGPPLPRPRPPHYGDEVQLDLGRVTRWLFEFGLDAGSVPIRYAIDSAHSIITVTFGDIDDLIAWALRFGAHQPHRLPADEIIGHTVVQTELARHGWLIVFRMVEA